MQHFSSSILTNIMKYLTSALFGLMLSGGLMASSAIAAPSTSIDNSQVQHLTCIRDSQGLMCNVDESSKVQSTSQLNLAGANNLAPELITTEQLAQLSDFLIGIMFFGLPCSLVFAVLLHDKREAERDRLVAQLERIWIDPRS
jgi:hypothetical protein